MKRIIGIPFSRKKTNGEKAADSEKEEKRERTPPPQKPLPPGLPDMIKKVDEKADDLERKIDLCNQELKKIASNLRSLPEGVTKNRMKSRAQSILQRKKVFEQQVDSMRQQSFNIEQTSAALQSTKDAVTVVKVMKQGVKELKKEQKKIDIESVEDLNDELGELFQQSEDVQDVLARDFNMPVIDDQELEEQLALLGDDILLDNDSSYLDEAMAGTKPQANAGISSLTEAHGGVIGRSFTMSAKERPKTGSLLGLDDLNTPNTSDQPPSNSLGLNDILFESSKSGQ